jgi:hypothetical protein
MQKKLLVAVVLVQVLGVTVLLCVPGWRDCYLAMVRRDYFVDGRPYGYWVRELDQADPSRREVAVLVLWEHGARADAIPGLIRVLGYGPFEGRGVSTLVARDETPVRAAEALAKIGQPAVPALTLALQDDSYMRRVRAAYALWKLGVAGEAVSAVFLGAPQQKDWDVLREATILLVDDMGPEAELQMPEVFRAIRVFLQKCHPGMQHKFRDFLNNPS